MRIGVVETSAYEDSRTIVDLTVDPACLETLPHNQQHLPWSSHEDLGERHLQCLPSEVAETPKGRGNASFAQT